MDDILRVFDDMMGCGPVNFQESQETMQVNHRQSPAPAPYNSYENISFNQHQILNGLSFGVHGIQQFNRPVMFLDGRNNEGIKDFAENSQLSIGRGGQSGLSEISQLSIGRGGQSGLSDASQLSIGRGGQSGLSETSQLSVGQGGQSGLSETGTEQVWQRIRWTDDMVKVLITAASYIGEFASSDGPECETNPFLVPIKGKWKSISHIMVERGYKVSPQQCEDKFNDLNKKYKRLNDILGRSISCDVVENPSLMESMNIPEESKEEVKKILTCKQLFYREMCSYHNKNTTFLPHDAPLHQSVRSALKGKVKYGSQSQSLTLDMPAKRQKHGEDNTLVNVVLPEAIEGKKNELSEWIVSCSVKLAEKKLKMQNEMLELEKRKFEWLKFRQQEEKELERMKLENELIKLENERLEFEIKCRQRGNAPY